jgi:hypothetical protein
MVYGPNNRAENAHLPTWRRKIIMRRFTSARHLKRFVSIHVKIANRSMMLAKPHAGTIGQPEPPLLRLLCRNLQPLAPPDPLDPLVVHHPAGGRTQKLRDLPIAIPAILANQFGHVLDEGLFIVRPLGASALRRTMLPENAANPPLGQLQFRPDMVDAGATPRGAQKFPLAASARIILSSVRSETARRSRAFSASSSFIRLT